MAMKKISALLFTILIAYGAAAQDLYSKAYGNPKHTPLLFLHGGPGYNSVNFEVTTAQKLADKGYYVIVYDRRGEGRSEDVKGMFNFKETFQDIDNILTKYQISKATLIGHSFGGVIAPLYAEKHPDKVTSIVLVSAPVNLQSSSRSPYCLFAFSQMLNKSVDK